MNYQPKSLDRTVRFMNIPSSHGSIDSKVKGEYSVLLNKKPQKVSSIQELFNGSSKSKVRVDYYLDVVHKDVIEEVKSGSSILDKLRNAEK